MLVVSFTLLLHYFIDFIDRKIKKPALSVSHCYHIVLLIQRQQLELANRFSESHTTDILGTIDYKIVHCPGSEKVICHKKLPNCTLITQYVWRNNHNAASGGASLLIRNSFVSSLSDVKIVTERIIIATLDGNPTVKIIVYSPQEGTNDAQNHYEDLTNCIKDIPKQSPSRNGRF